jgi:quinoprotein glucose dehydrogenase
MAMLFVASVASAPALADGGYFSREQAERGKTLYQQHCSECHGKALEGRNAVPLSGTPFTSRWADVGATVDDLWYLVRSQMPYGAPGTLPALQSLDIVAFILSENGYPEGSAELPPVAGVLFAKSLARRPPP